MTYTNFGKQRVELRNPCLNTGMSKMTDRDVTLELYK